MDVAKFAHNRDLIRVLVAKELKVRYRSTFLGYAWSLLHPLAFATVFFILFRVVMRIQMENYALFLIAGLFPWQWLQNSITAASQLFLNNRTLIKKVRFPRDFLVVAGVSNDLIHFAISIPVILGFMLHFRTWPTWAWLWGLPALIAVQLALTYGAALMVATVNLFFRDLERLVLILTMLWFYLTPVLYPVEMIPPEWQWVVYANPAAPVIVCWRALFLEGAAPAGLLAVGAAWAAAVFAVGHWLYAKLEWRFAEVV